MQIWASGRLTVGPEHPVEAADGDVAGVAAAEHRRVLMSEHVSLAVAALRKTDEATRERIANRVIASVGSYMKDVRVHIPGAARCIVGTKQSNSEPTTRDLLLDRKLSDRFTTSVTGRT